MNPTDRLIAWATGTLSAFGVAAFTVLYIIMPAVAAARDALAPLAGS